MIGSTASESATGDPATGNPALGAIPPADAPPRLVYLSLGANLGDRAGTIARAVKLIAASDGVRLIRVSGLYATEPVGYEDQPEFLNNAVALETTRSPQRLLARLRAIERALGRRPRAKWHEREIDIDILLFGDLELSGAELTVPHPQMHLRAFVLVPLAEIAPDAVHPVLHRRISELATAISTTGVRPWDAQADR